MEVTSGGQNHNSKCMTMLLHVWVYCIILVYYYIPISQTKSPRCCHGCSELFQYLLLVEQPQDFSLYEFRFSFYSMRLWISVKENNGHTDIWTHKCKHCRYTQTDTHLHTHTHTEVCATRNCIN